MRHANSDSMGTYWPTPETYSRRSYLKAFLYLFLVAALLAVQPVRPAAEPSHALAMHGEAKEGRDFTHFSYANPEAPKGGRVTLGTFGSFDSLSPMIVRGEPAQGVREFVIESLLARGQDEPFTLYGLLAESVDVPTDRSEITFHLNRQAKFSDGMPVTADDVLFSHKLLMTKGRPNYRTYYKKVTRAERLSDHKVRFVLGSGDDRELPLILGLMPILPRHAVKSEDFDKTSLVPLIGSGPYKLTGVDVGRSVTYERDPNYWGRDLPVNKGRFNFDEIRFDYFREASTQFEAFKTGQIDIRTEDDPALWAQGYAFANKPGAKIALKDIPIGLPSGMEALAFNTRRSQFADARVREALVYLFNFEWVNKTLYHGLYKRTQSYFERSYLSSIGRPADARERELLAPYLDSVRPEILNGTFRQPVGDGTGHNRTNAQKAFKLLRSAGYRLVDGRLIHEKTKTQLAFEILAASRGQERLLSSFAGELERIGIAVRLRVVDSAQYQSRLKDYDFDMIQFTWRASLSPGNEQLFRWSSQVADQPGSFNFPGVKSPAADAMIKAMLQAEKNEDFVSAVRALDRVLLSGIYVIPLFHVPTQWVAYSTRLGAPAKAPTSGFNIDTWWVKPGQ
jgi:peptide/nickel transport system substrate-binding protein